MSGKMKHIRNLGFLTIFGLILTGTMSNGVFWIQPGVNHIVACCDIISFNATQLNMNGNKNDPISSNVTLNNTPISKLTQFQLPDPDSTSLSLPPGSVVLPLVSSFNFYPPRWYNICLTRTAHSSICFPARPCQCDCDENPEGSAWLKTLVNVSFKSQRIQIRLTSQFSSDNIFKVRFNVTLESEGYYQYCNDPIHPPSNADESEQEEYQIRIRQCKREPEPKKAHHIPPSEELHITRKDVGGLPFYILISIGLSDSGKYFGREIIHQLDPIKVEKNEENKNANFERLIIIPIPTPRMEEERHVLDWDEQDSKRICPIVNSVDCSLSTTCSKGRSDFKASFMMIMTIILIGIWYGVECVPK